MAIAGAAALNNRRAGVLLAVFCQNEMTKASMTTVTVPAAEPNNRTDVKTKVSDTERLTGTDGSLIVKQPASTVMAARISHSPPGGVLASSRSELLITHKPMQITAAR